MLWQIKNTATVLYHSTGKGQNWYGNLQCKRRMCELLDITFKINIHENKVTTNFTQKQLCRTFMSSMTSIYSDLWLHIKWHVQMRHDKKVRTVGDLGNPVHSMGGCMHATFGQTTLYLGVLHTSGIAYMHRYRSYYVIVHSA